MHNKIFSIVILAALFITACTKPPEVVTKPNIPTALMVSCSSPPVDPLLVNSTATWRFHFEYPADATHLNYELLTQDANGARCGRTSTKTGLNVYDSHDLEFQFQCEKSFTWPDASKIQWRESGFGGICSGEMQAGLFRDMKKVVVHRNPQMLPNGDVVLMSGWKDSTSSKPDIAVIINFQLSKE